MRYSPDRYHRAPAPVLCPRCRCNCTTYTLAGSKAAALVECANCDWSIDFEAIQAERKARHLLEEKKRRQAQAEKARKKADYAKRRGGSNPT